MTARKATQMSSITSQVARIRAISLVCGMHGAYKAIPARFVIEDDGLGFATPPPMRLFLTIMFSLVTAVGCAKKAPPQSTTVTKTQVETTNDSGDKASSESKQTTVMEADGTKKTTVQKTDTSVSPGTLPKK